MGPRQRSLWPRRNLDVRTLVLFFFALSLSREVPYARPRMSGRTLGTSSGVWRYFRYGLGCGRYLRYVLGCLDVLWIRPGVSGGTLGTQKLLPPSYPTPGANGRQRRPFAPGVRRGSSVCAPFWSFAPCSQRTPLLRSWLLADNPRKQRQTIQGSSGVPALLAWARPLLVGPFRRR